MPDPFTKLYKRKIPMGSTGQRHKVLALAIALGWTGFVAPANGAQVRLDTAHVPVAEIAGALRRAFQLPTLIASASAPSQESEMIERERLRLGQLMIERGYLNAKVTTAPTSSGLVLEPVVGQAFTVGSVELKGVQQDELGPTGVADLAARVGAFVGQPATASAARVFTRQVLDRIGEQDFALARLKTMNWTPSDNGTAIASFTVEMGPPCHFGKVVFKGLPVNADDLRDLVPFRQGDRYERAKLEHFRSNLASLKGIRSFNLDLEKDEEDAVVIYVRLLAAPADPAILDSSGATGLWSGLASLAMLGAAQMASVAGVRGICLRALFLASGFSVATFCVTAWPRLVAFLSG